MELSLETINVLKNFSTFTRKIVVTPGKVLQTRTPSFYAEATVKEDFPIKFGIPDLEEFLRIIALIKDPVLEFRSGYIEISEADGSAQTQYSYADPGSIDCLSTKRKKGEFPLERITFMLAEDLLAQTLAASGFGESDKDGGSNKYLRVVSDGNSVRIAVQDSEGRPGPVEVLGTNADTHGYTCNMMFDKANLPLMAGSYEMTVCRHFMQCKNISGYDLLYLVGAELRSSLWEGEPAYPPIETKRVPLSHDEYLAKIQNEELMLTKANALNKSTIFDVLAAAGVTDVTIEFDGEGDSGQIGRIDIAPTEDTTALLATSVTISELQWDQQELTPLSTTLEDALERLCYGFLEQECEGWEVNEGSNGEFVFDVATRVIDLDCNMRTTDYDHHTL